VRVKVSFIVFVAFSLVFGCLLNYPIPLHYPRSSPLSLGVWLSVCDLRVCMCVCVCVCVVICSKQRTKSCLFPLFRHTSFSPPSFFFYCPIRSVRLCMLAAVAVAAAAAVAIDLPTSPFLSLSVYYVLASSSSSSSSSPSTPLSDRLNSVSLPPSPPPSLPPSYCLSS